MLWKHSHAIGYEAATSRAGRSFVRYINIFAIEPKGRTSTATQIGTLSKLFRPEPPATVEETASGTFVVGADIRGLGDIPSQARP